MYIGYDVIHAIRAGSVRVTERGCSERKRKSSVTYHQQAQSTRTCEVTFNAML